MLCGEPLKVVNLFIHFLEWKKLLEMTDSHNAGRFILYFINETVIAIDNPPYVGRIKFWHRAACFWVLKLFPVRISLD